MPEKETLKRAERDRREGKAPSTQAGEFIREEMHHIREGKHGARSAKQAVAIGLSKARQAGVKLPPPKKGSQKTRSSARHAYERGQEEPNKKPSAKRSRATRSALEREPREAASHKALSRQGRSAAAGRSRQERSAAARKASRTKGSAGRSASAHKAASTRAKKR